jgi:Tetratricopeptide repeat
VTAAVLCNPATVDLAGKSVVIAGRLESLARRQAIALVRERGGTLGRDLSRRTGCLVVGHDAAGLVASGTLQTRIEAADRAAVPCLSELGFLRALSRPGMAADEEPEAGEAAAFSAEDIVRTSGLPADLLRVLALLDIVELDRGRGGFAAMSAARQAGRLLKSGSTLADLVASLSALRQRDALTRHHFDLDEKRRLVLRLGDRVADADGQMRLALPDAGNPALDELMAVAEEAEAACDWPAAEALYRRCLKLDEHDPTAPFNLANVLREQGRVREAVLFCRMALARAPGFAEAWYNLGDLAEAAGDAMLARHSLERALRCDPGFADAAFNLARLHYAAGAYAQAAAEWQRYLERDPDSTWARKARHGIALCRQHLRKSK